MTCECKDENGSLMDKCLGVFKPISQANIVEEQRRAHFELTIHQDMIHMGKRIAALEQKIVNIPKEVMEAHNNGFMEGFKRGYESDF